MEEIIEGKKYLLVKGWETVQDYLGTKISVDIMRSEGIKRVGKKGAKGRGKKMLYAIPYTLLEKRLKENKDKSERLNTSVLLLNNWKQKQTAWKELDKYRFKTIEVDFDFHLYEPDVQDAERVDEEVRVIEIPHTTVEFGIESEPEDREKVTINFGFGGVKLHKDDLVRAYEDWQAREKIMEKFR